VALLLAAVACAPKPAAAPKFEWVECFEEFPVHAVDERGKPYEFCALERSGKEVWGRCDNGYVTFEPQCSGDSWPTGTVRCRGSSQVAQVTATPVERLRLNELVLARDTR
jgi:hypothetical protein